MLFGIVTVYSYVSFDDLHVLQETITGLFTGQAFHSWAALNFKTSGLMDNKLVCNRVVTDINRW